MLKKVILAWLLFVCCLCFAAFASAAADPRDLSREKMLFRNYSGDGSLSVSSFCMEGHVFLMVNGNLSNQASIVQVYEEKNGKIVPKRCN